MRWCPFIAVAIVALGGFALAADAASPGIDIRSETFGEKTGEVAARDAQSGNHGGWCDVDVKSMPISIVRWSRDNVGHAARAMRSGPVWSSAVPVDEARWTSRVPGYYAECSFRSAATLQSRSTRLQI